MGGGSGERRRPHHVGHERFEVLDGFLSLVLLPLAVDLFGLLRSGLLDLTLAFPQAGLDAGLALQLALLLQVQALHDRNRAGGNGNKHDAAENMNTKRAPVRPFGGRPASPQKARRHLEHVQPICYPQVCLERTSPSPRPLGGHLVVVAQSTVLAQI